MISDSTLQRADQGKCLDDLARLMLQIEKYGISRDGPESDAIEIMADIHRGLYFPFAQHHPAIRAWARDNRYHIDDKLRDECLDYIVLFETVCMVWDPREYEVIFFNLAANILKELPPGYPDIPKMGLVRRLRNVMRNWRSLGL